MTPPPPAVLPAKVLFAYNRFDLTAAGRSAVEGLLPRARAAAAMA